LGGDVRFLLLHNEREPVVSVLNDAARTLEDLRAELPSVVDEAAAPLRKRSDATRDAQNQLWGQAKALR
jgi:hypothetical protein